MNLKLYKMMIKAFAMAIIMIATTCKAYDFNLALFVPVTKHGANGRTDCIQSGASWATSTDTCFYQEEYAALSSMGQLAMTHFNERNNSIIKEFGDLQDCKLNFETKIYDSGFSPDLAVRNTIEMIMNLTKIHGVVGPASSAASIPTALINGALDVPQISFQATSTELDDSKYASFMRTIPSDADVANSICKYWQSNGYVHASMVYFNDDYGERYKEALVTSCTQLGFESIQTYPFFDKESLKTQVDRMGESAIRVFLFVSLDGYLSTLIDQGLKYNLFSNSMWLVSDGISTSDLNSLTLTEKEAFTGALRVVATGGSTKNPVWNKFVQQYETFTSSELVGREQWPDLWKSYPNTFDVTDGANLPEIRNIGSFMYDAIAAFVIGACAISKEEDQLGENFGPEFLANSTNIQFQGLTGNVKFLESGNRDPTTAAYEMSNLKFDSISLRAQFQTVATFENGSTWEFSTQPTFNGESQELPSDTIKPFEEKNFNATLKTVLHLMATFNLIFAGFLVLWTIKQRNHIVIRASQVIFLASIAFGVMISSSAIYVIAIDDEDSSPEDQILAYEGLYRAASISCMLGVYLYSIGFTITFGSMFAKMWRISRLLDNARSFQKVVVPNSLLFMIIACLLMVDLTILAAWTIVDPLTFQREITSTDQFGNPTESTGVCAADSAAGFLFFLGIFHLAILVGGNYIAWKCRKINSTFQEGRWVATAMWSYFQVLLLGIPVLVIVADSPDALMFVKGCVIFLNDISLLLFLFVPKALGVHFQYFETSGRGGELFQNYAGGNSKSSLKIAAPKLSSGIENSSLHGPESINSPTAFDRTTYATQHNASNYQARSIVSSTFSESEL